MEPMTFFFYIIMAILGIAVLYFVGSFIYVLILNFLKIVILFYHVFIILPIAGFLSMKDLPYIGLPILLAAVILSIVMYPKKRVVEIPESNRTVTKWPKTPRGRLLNKIDGALAKS